MKYCLFFRLMCLFFRREKVALDWLFFLFIVCYVVWYVICGSSGNESRGMFF